MRIASGGEPGSARRRPFRTRARRPLCGFRSRFPRRGGNLQGWRERTRTEHRGDDLVLGGHRCTFRAWGPTAFSLLVLTERPHRTRLFLKKRRTSLPCPVQSRSENALELALVLAASVLATNMVPEKARFTKRRFRHLAPARNVTFASSKAGKNPPNWTPVRVTYKQGYQSYRDFPAL